MRHFEVIIVGLGGMGSAAAWHLARRQKKTLGLERFSPAHDRGSSHGHSRVIRQAYFEDPAYVPLLLRAYQLWRELEEQARQNLLTITGGLMIGTPESIVVSGSIGSARRHGLEHEVLSAGEIRRRFPHFAVPDDHIALFEAATGFVHPRKAVLAYQRLAEEQGAELHFEERVLDWKATTEGVEVKTDAATYSAERLILSPGAWASELFKTGPLPLPLTVERQVLYWFEPIGGVEPFMPDRFPVYFWDLNGSEFYGFPHQPGEGYGGLKVAFYRMGRDGRRQSACHPDRVERSIFPEEVERMRAAFATRFPALNGPLVGAETCLYTSTPDGHFIVDLHPETPRVALASPCSGHGFKFTPVIGEILADLATEGTAVPPAPLPASPLFGLRRFGS